MLCNINTHITTDIDINPSYNILQQITNEHHLLPCLHYLFNSMRLYVLQSYFSTFKYNYNNLIYNFKNTLIHSDKIYINRIEITLDQHGQYDIHNNCSKNTWNNYNISIKFLKQINPDTFIIKLDSIHSVREYIFYGWVNDWPIIQVSFITKKKFNHHYIKRGTGVIVIDTNNKYELYTNIYNYQPNNLYNF